MSSDDALKNSTPEEIVRENVVEDDGEDPFDGVLSDSTRGAVVEHGLPLDLASFTTRDSDQELEAGTEVTRALTALDLSGPTPHALEPDSPLAEFDAASATRGGFVAGAGLFGSAELTAPAVVSALWRSCSRGGLGRGERREPHCSVGPSLFRSPVCFLSTSPRASPTPPSSRQNH